MCHPHIVFMSSCISRTGASLPKFFKDSARELCNEMKVRAHERVKFELFYGETDLWFELGHVMNNFHTLKYVFSFNSRR